MALFGAQGQQSLLAASASLSLSTPAAPGVWELEGQAGASSGEKLGELARATIPVQGHDCTGSYLLRILTKVFGKVPVTASVQDLSAQERRPGLVLVSRPFVSQLQCYECNRRQLADSPSIGSLASLGACVSDLG